MPLKIHAHNPMVVVLKSHLEIETGELGQVPVGVGVLGPEYGTNFILPLHICGNGHLLGQLGRLCQKGGLAEVVDLGDNGTEFSGSGLKFWRLYLGETLRIKECSEWFVIPARTQKIEWETGVWRLTRQFARCVDRHEGSGHWVG